MFDIVDTTFSYERELIVYSFLQDFSTGKGSSLKLNCNAHTAFLLCGAELSKSILNQGMRAKFNSNFLRPAPETGLSPSS